MVETKREILGFSWDTGFHTKLSFDLSFEMSYFEIQCLEQTVNESLEIENAHA